MPIVFLLNLDPAQFLFMPPNFVKSFPFSWEEKLEMSFSFFPSDCEAFYELLLRKQSLSALLFELFFFELFELSGNPRFKQNDNFYLGKYEWFEKLAEKFVFWWSLCEFQ